MQEIILNKNKIKIKEHSRNDIGNVKKFRSFINSLIEEGAQIIFDKKVSFKEEREWLKNQLEKQKNKKMVSFVAETGGKIIGIAEIYLLGPRQNHIGFFGITISKGYRGMGLGTYLMAEIIKLAGKELKLKFLRLRVFSTNKSAIGLYKKFGFKEAARIPKQIQYKGKLVDEIIMLKNME